MPMPDPLRRLLLGGGLAGAAAGAVSWLAGGRGALAQQSGAHVALEAHQGSAPHAVHGGMTTVGEVDNARNGFDPHTILTDWDTGTLSVADDGRTLARPSRSSAEDKEIEIAPGPDVPGLDLQRPRARPDPARDRGRPAADRVQERRLAPAQHALPRHPLRRGWTACPVPG